jgi:tetratricopeptide (TPR) repeat protein
MSSESLAALAAHVAEIERSGDRSAALDAGMLHMARRTAEALGGDDLDAWSLIGRFYWLRFQALPTESEDLREDALAAAVDAIIPCFLAELDILEELRPTVAVSALPWVVELQERMRELPDEVVIDKLPRLWKRVLEAIPDDDPGLSQFRFLLGSAHHMRFALTGDRAELDEAIAVVEQVTASLPAGDPMLPNALMALSEALRGRFEDAGDPADLDQAIALSRRAMELGFPDGSRQAELLVYVGTALLMRFQQAGDRADVDQAITLIGRAAKASRDARHAYAVCMTSLCDAWRCRFGSTDDLADLNRAITCGREALAAGPRNRGMCLYYLSGALLLRAEQGGGLADVDAALRLLPPIGKADEDEAIDADDLTRALLLSGVSFGRFARFGWTGAQADLDASVGAAERALEGPWADHARFAMLTGNLSVALATRFERYRSQADLERAIALGRRAVTLSAGPHPGRALFLSNAGLTLRLRFIRGRELSDLEEATAMCREAVAAVPEGNSDWARHLSNLALILLTWYTATPDASVLDEAVVVSRKAAAAVPVGHTRWPSYQYFLGYALSLRGELTGQETDLAEAIAALRHAVAATPDGHPNQAQYLSILGNALQAEGDTTDAIAVFSRAARSPSAQAPMRIMAARAAAMLLTEPAPGQAADLLELAVRLLPLAAPRLLTRTDQQHELSGLRFLASDAAALALAAGGQGQAARAVGLLELGRAVLHGQALDTRTDLTELDAARPALARRFLELRDELDVSAGDALDVLSLDALAGGFRAGRELRRRAAAAEFAALLDQIRSLDGFESFLLPPEPGQLTRHAHGGPIVVLNVSRYRSDALIITAQQIIQLPLPGLAFDTVLDKVDGFNGALDVLQGEDADLSQRLWADNMLSETLEWLWDAAAEPVLTRLGHLGPPQASGHWPRVWWVPGGLLGLLPLHAAGYHHSTDARTVMDRVVSSYTPTVRALVHAREHELTDPPTRSLIVAASVVPGQPALSQVTVEAAALRDSLPRPTVLTESDPEHLPTKSAVLACLPDAGIAHFCCHAASHPSNPSQSELVLGNHQEDPLTVASLIPVRLDHAQLAYLSACETARNEAADLLDEAIHLTAAFQLAGYPHVIGTLWAIRDRTAADIAGSFYAHLRTGPRTFDITAAAHALHHAVRNFRDRQNLGRSASLWAAYIHTGA